MIRATTEQARRVGNLQRLVVTGDSTAAAASLRRLAPTYGQLAEELEVASAAISTADQ